ncbi:hypothetical protein BDZ90DRAFT_228673 [Jaminaea rosea]|uniref:Uncharacterized protein n=1 Tax=Jaminaea rosea TaxID=1569628 RepID=A0A316UHE1_9BASI|nr:hypothetical protein BDZ90DRAFT_228673 [Jaminaea rosea]PWN24672.1 hypothetical protein BDZ90DRAFT_228673 [Jaminaea rosea]
MSPGATPSPERVTISSFGVLLPRRRFTITVPQPAPSSKSVTGHSYEPSTRFDLRSPPPSSITSSPPRRSLSPTISPESSPQGSPSLTNDDAAELFSGQLDLTMPLQEATIHEAAREDDGEAKEGPLNVIHKGRIERVHYVAALPVPGDLLFHVDASEGAVFRRARPHPAAEREALWRSVVQGGFLGELSSSLSPTWVKLNVPFLDGPTKIHFSHLSSWQTLPTKPRTATAEVSYMLERHDIFLTSMVTQDGFKWAPVGEDVGKDWSALLRPLGVVASETMQDPLPYVGAECHGLLVGMGVRLRLDGSSCRLTHSMREGWSIIDVPGDACTWAEWATFQLIAECRPRAEVKLPHQDPNGFPYDIILYANETGGIRKKDGKPSRALYKETYYALRTRDVTRPIGPQSRDKKRLHDVAPEWMVFFLLNLVALSRGCKDVELFKPGGSILAQAARRIDLQASVAAGPPTMERSMSL